MKSPHLLSIVHDLVICTRSAQSSQKEKISSQLRLSSHSNSAVSYHDRFPPRIMLWVFSPILTKALSECPFFSYLPGQVLICRTRDPFYDIANGALSRTRLHDHFSGDPPYTTIALQPIVSAATIISHTNTQRPYQKTTVVLFNAVVLGSMS